MTERAIDLLQVDSTHSVLDLFCGLGNFSLPLARRAKHVLGIEGDAGLVECAKANAVRNGIANAQFIAANLMAEDQDAPWTRERYDRVLIDPPHLPGGAPSQAWSVACVLAAWWRLKAATAEKWRDCLFRSEPC